MLNPNFSTAISSPHQKQLLQLKLTYNSLELNCIELSLLLLPLIKCNLIFIESLHMRRELLDPSPLKGSPSVELPDRHNTILTKNTSPILPSP